MGKWRERIQGETAGTGGHLHVGYGKLVYRKHPEICEQYCGGLKKLDLWLMPLLLSVSLLE